MAPVLSGFAWCLLLHKPLQLIFPIIFWQETSQSICDWWSTRRSERRSWSPTEKEKEPTSSWWETRIRRTEGSCRWGREKSWRIDRNPWHLNVLKWSSYVNEFYIFSRAWPFTVIFIGSQSLFKRGIKRQAVSLKKKNQKKMQICFLMTTITSYPININQSWILVGAPLALSSMEQVECISATWICCCGFPELHLKWKQVKQASGGIKHPKQLHSYGPSIFWCQGSANDDLWLPLLLWQRHIVEY